MAKMIFALQIFFMLQYGQAAPQMNLRLERSEMGSHLQNAVAFDTKSVRVVRNSNFLCPVQNFARVGVFSKIYNPVLTADHDEIEQIYKRIHKNPKTPINQNGFDKSNPSQLYIRDARINEGSPYFKRLTQILDSYCDLADWKIENAVQVDWKSGEEGRTLRVSPLSKDGVVMSQKSIFLSFDQAHCQKKSTAPEMSCLIPEKGWVYLSAPDLKKK